MQFGKFLLVVWLCRLRVFALVVVVLSLKLAGWDCDETVSRFVLLCSFRLELKLFAHRVLVIFCLIVYTVLLLFVNAVWLGSLQFCCLVMQFGLAVYSFYVVL